MNGGTMILTTYELICIAKSVKWPPKPKNKSHPSHHECDIEFASAAPGKLVGFVRANSMLSESFTIGLRYHAANLAPSILLRVNGDHGRHPNPDGTEVTSGPHLHTPSYGHLHLPPDPTQREEWAVPLDPSCTHLPAAWRIFCETANVTPDHRIAKLLAAVHASGAQLDLFEELSRER